MEHKDEQKTGLIGWILSRKEGQQFLAASLLVVITLSGVVSVLSMKIVNLEDENKNMIIEDNIRLIKSDQRFIDYIRLENVTLMKYKYKVDSAKTELELFKLKKEMR